MDCNADQLVAFGELPHPVDHFVGVPIEVRDFRSEVTDKPPECAVLLVNDSQSLVKACDSGRDFFVLTKSSCK